MKEKIDYIYLPSIKQNDILNTGNNISGKAFITSKFFIIIPDKVQDAVGLTTKKLYNKDWFEKLVSKLNNIETTEFETEIIGNIPERYIMPFSNFEKFEINVGFLFFGGLRFKTKGEKIQSTFIGNTANRKMVKEFYEKCVL